MVNTIDMSSPGSEQQSLSKGSEMQPSSPMNGPASPKMNSPSKNLSSSSLTSQTRSRPNRDLQRVTSLRKRRGSRRHSNASLGFAHVDSCPSMASLELEDIDVNEVPWWTSHRFRLAILCFFGFVCLYAQRVNLSIAIVSMTSHKHVSPNGGDANNTDVTFNSTNSSTDSMSYATTQNPHLEYNAKCPILSDKDLDGEFHWSKELKGLILGAFFWGYLVLQVPGGSLGERFGAKRVVAICLFPVAILNLLTPLAARASPYMLLVLRVLVGIGEGVMYPAAQALWANWSPPNERSRLIGFSYAGGQFGNAIIFPIGGFLSAYGTDGGWPCVFYFIGTISFFWCILWVIYAADTPDQMKGISDIEKKYIKACIGTRSKKRGIPWKSIFTCKAMYAILVGHMCGNYGAYMLLTKIPSYMKEVLKFDIKSNGLYSMMPYLAFWACITVSGMIADTIISREYLSIKNTRKLMTAIGMFGPAIFLVATGFMECDQAAGAVAMLTISVGLCGFHFSGFFINHADIAPSFAGTLFGITNTMATVPGILSPYIVSAMTPNGTREEWQSTFYVAASIYVFGAIVYLIFGQGEVQPWAMTEKEAKMKTGMHQDSVTFALHDIHEADEKEREDKDEDEDEDDDSNDNNLITNLTKTTNGDIKLNEHAHFV